MARTFLVAVDVCSLEEHKKVATIHLSFIWTYFRGSWNSAKCYSKNISRKRATHPRGPFI